MRQTTINYTQNLSMSASAVYYTPPPNYYLDNPVKINQIFSKFPAWQVKNILLGRNL